MNGMTIKRVNGIEREQETVIITEVNQGAGPSIGKRGKQDTAVISSWGG